LRTQLGEQAGRLRSTANDTYHQASDKVSQIVERGRDAYDRARGTGSSTSESGFGSPGSSSSFGSGTGSPTGTTGGYTPAGSNRG
jgi:hypothetical protein